MWHEEGWRDAILTEPDVWGIEELGAQSMKLRLVVQTLPLEQWRARRSLGASRPRWTRPASRLPTRRSRTAAATCRRPPPKTARPVARRATGRLRPHYTPDERDRPRPSPPWSSSASSCSPPCSSGSGSACRAAPGGSRKPCAGADVSRPSPAAALRRHQVRHACATGWGRRAPPSPDRSGRSPAGERSTTRHGTASRRRCSSPTSACRRRPGCSTSCGRRTAARVDNPGAARHAPARRDRRRPLGRRPFPAPRAGRADGVAVRRGERTGKTTTIAKLARHEIDAGRPALMAAADTFRRSRRSAWSLGRARRRRRGARTGGRRPRFGRLRRRGRGGAGAPACSSTPPAECTPRST